MTALAESSARERNLARLAWGMCAASWLLLAVAIAVGALVFGKPHPQGFSHVLWEALVTGCILLPWSVVGAIIASSRPYNAVGWIFCAAALGGALANALAAYAEYALLVDTSLPGGGYVAAISNALYAPSLYYTAVLLFLVFPDGHFLSKRWRALAILLSTFAWTTFVATPLTPGAIDSFGATVNPMGVNGSIVGFLNTAGSSVLAPFAFATAATAIIVRLRRSRGAEREQVKWVLWSAAVTGISLVVAFIAPWNVLQSVGWITGLVSEAAFAVICAVAILRFHLYEIDRIVNRTVVYGIVTVVLAGLYAGVVVAFDQVFDPLTQKSGLAVAASTLLVAVLFRPVRRWVQSVVDRRFYRRRYDAQRTLEVFSATLRDEVDLDTLATHLRGVVVETMQPAHVSLWLRTPETER